jgi:ADP-ribose pyrophosphatase
VTVRLPPTTLQPWRELTREPVADCRVFKVERSIAISPVDEKPRPFHRIQSVDWAQIVPITTDGQVVMVRQYRHGDQRVTLEIPGGLLDPGEDPATAALRECLEETGYRARAALPLGVIAPNPALFANRLHSFYAVDVEPESAVQNTGTEVTEVVLVPAADLEELLLAGEIDHALVAGTLWRYLRLHVPR